MKAQLVKRIRRLVSRVSESRVFGLPLILLCGCATVPEANYYTLDMRASGAVSDTFTIRTVSLTTNDSLSRQNIMIRESPTQVTYYATHEWASSLRDMVAEKLLTEFGVADSQGTAVDLSGEILAFEQVDTESGAEARIKMLLEARPFDDKTTRSSAGLTKLYEVSVPADSRTPDAVVRALSVGLERLAGELAADLTTFEDRVPGE